MTSLCPLTQKNTPTPKLTLLASVAGLLTTNPVQPALLAPLAGQFAEAPGWPSKAALMTIAEQSHGGRYWEIDEVEALPGVIPDLHEEIPVRSRPTTLWDNWKVLTLLVSLLSVEWAVRKWSRLL